MNDLRTGGWGRPGGVSGQSGDDGGRGGSLLFTRILLICRGFVLCRRWDLNSHEEVALTGF